MARARNIKPGFFTNDELADVDPIGRLLFIGLWTMADREGRLEDRPRRIKAEVLPYDDADVDMLLKSLEESGFILRYTAGNDRYIQVLNFDKHQNPHMKEPESTIPAPCLSGAKPEPAPEEPPSCPADSGYLIPDSTTDPTPPQPPAGGERVTTLAERFDTFWAAYPRKTAKDAARRRWDTLKPDDDTLELMIAALEWQRDLHEWRKEDGRFIPHPATWLNAGQWKDEKPANITQLRPEPEDRRSPYMANF